MGVDGAGFGGADQGAAGRGVGAGGGASGAPSGVAGGVSGVAGAAAGPRFIDPIRVSGDGCLPRALPVDLALGETATLNLRQEANAVDACVCTRVSRHSADMTRRW